ncbi:MAG: dethiobiotin synthase [Dehalococcoidia bacterium]
MAERFRFFVTGTDTGAGKTVVTAAIACLAVEAGQRLAAFKPAQTGVAPDEPGDLEFVRAAAGASPLLTTAYGYRLREPLAPAVAAQREGVRIDPAAILEQYEGLASEADVVLVEGAGGLLAPLADGYLMADLARELNIPMLVVARPGLGTLNHTALTVEAARSRAIEVAGVVISGYPAEPDLATRTNPRLMVELTGAPLLGVLPHIEGLSTDKLRTAGLAQVARDALAPALGGCFDSGAFLDRESVGAA